MIITQAEFMRRMKEQQMAGGANMMGAMPEMYNLVVNTNHQLIGEIAAEKDESKQKRLLSQVIDLAMLSQNMLKGQDLSDFVKRSVELIK
jgi:molecular chaperone HtpG